MESQQMRVLVQLRDMILKGSFAPGERLAEIPLSEQLQASRTPVRLALTTLEQEGLVEPSPSGGYAMRRFTAKEIDDAIAVRGMLEGITRRSVLELARESGIVCEERPVSIKELMASDEVFLSSTAGGIMPVTQIDAQFVGNGHPGVVTEQVNAIYWQSHASARYATPIDYGWA